MSKRNLALRNVQRYFPRVVEVNDADVDLQVEVTSKDEASSAKKDHAHCAMATACKRVTHADGVIISTGFAYIINGKRATRFLVNERIGREITAFDRGSRFYPGVYTLKRPYDSARLGSRATRNTFAEGTRPPKSTPRRQAHVTLGIRTSLGRE